MEEHLRSNLITIGTIEVLEGEEVFSFTTFSSLREQPSICYPRKYLSDNMLFL